MSNKTLHNKLPGFVILNPKQQGVKTCYVYKRCMFHEMSSFNNLTQSEPLLYSMQ